MPSCLLQDDVTAAYDLLLMAEESAQSVNNLTLLHYRAAVQEWMMPSCRCCRML